MVVADETPASGTNMKVKNNESVLKSDMRDKKNIYGHSRTPRYKVQMLEFLPHLPEDDQQGDTESSWQ